ncbi:MAG: hypothetical protein CMI56_00425 [Parcubacteria group bacterium]|nr:hypothetical protein [Parcubacteria group bacterium]|tara:strand:- start:12343 stop:13260 length:918 start_codon:yes stop_codon:yes gene_type:complete
MYFMKKTISIVLLFFILGSIGYFVSQKSSTSETEVTDTTVVADITTDANTNETDVTKDESITRIGASVEGRDINAYHYGTGDTELLFVGGIHGGYSWNTVLVAYELMDYLEANPTVIPKNVKVTVIPVLNPDGLNTVIGTDGRFSKADVPTSFEDTIPGRFNARDVDLNRNFDCEWQPSSKWQSTTVSGGTETFSEPETQAIRDYVGVNQPEAVVVWYSAAGGVFASSCRNGVSIETNTLTNTYADASGYQAYEEFDFYEITGDMVNWLAKNNIPAISVLLSDHQSTEWEKNKKGIEAVFNLYAN